MKLLFLQMFMSVSMLSCNKDNHVDPDRLFYKLIPNQRFVKVNDTISFTLYTENDENFQLEYGWSADKGTLIGAEKVVQFIAPASKDDVWVYLNISDQYGTVYKDSVSIKVYKQFVILKADDLVSDNDLIFPSRWNKFIEYIENKEIKASIGIIGNSLAHGRQPYFNKIKDYHYKNIIEFWNHGYDHLVNGMNEHGEKVHEFKNTSLEYQKAQFEKSQTLAKNKLGFSFKTFGAPANGIDENTLKVIEADKTLKIWFYGNSAFSKLNLQRHAICEIEYPVHHPNFEKFKTNYDSKAELLVLQLHPNSWDETRFDEFYQVTEFLIAQGLTFINPYEYYSLINDVVEEIMF